MNESQPGLDEKFKDTDDPLRLVFVCAMWLTGFDAPSCSTVYLDKPMRNHTLMQTIARANRVFPGKHSGVIVDYANVFASLEKALAIYGAGKGGQEPGEGKDELVEELRQAVTEAHGLLPRQQVDLERIEALPAGSMERLEAIEDAMNALISPDALRRDFFGHERLVQTLYRAVKPDPAALEFSGIHALSGSLAEAIREQAQSRPAGHQRGDGGDQRAARRVDHRPGDPQRGRRRSTCRRSTSRRWRRGSSSRSTRTPTSKRSRPRSRPARKDDPAEPHPHRLRGEVRGADRELQRRQPQHRAAVRGTARTLQSLSSEQQRHVRENLSEEELVIFDILPRPAPDLTDGAGGGEEGRPGAAG